MDVAAPSAVLFILYRALGHATGLLTSAGVVFAVDFNHTITLGSILTAFIVIAIAGVFTVRSKIATIWRQEAEGERAAKQRLEEALAAERADRLVFERQQQEMRHDLKGEVVALKAQLKAVEAKTDLTVALEAIRVMNAELAEHVSGAIMQVMKTGSQLSEDRDHRTHVLLTEIRDKLPTEPFKVHEITEGDR